SHAFLIETNVTVDDRDTWFGRFEAASKTAHDLAVAESADASTVAKLQGGYTRYRSAWKGLKPGVGVSVSAGFVPKRLEPAYGSRINVGFGVFVTLRPAAMMMRAGNAAASAVPRMVMVQTSLDPAKLSCSPRIDPKDAPKTTYQGKTYYFC